MLQVVAVRVAQTQPLLRDGFAALLGTAIALRPER